MSPAVVFQDLGSGPPILWIHGFPLSSGVWREQFDIDGVRHIAPDLPGFGPSPPLATPRPRIEHYAHALLALLDDLRIERTVIAGLSMGGYIALSLVGLAPERARALILADTRETPDTDEGRKKRWETIDLVNSEGLDPLISSMLPRLVRPDDDKVAAATLVMRRATIPGVVAALEAMAEREDSSAAISRMDLPALIVVGSEDEITPPSDARRMRDVIPNARLVEISGARHLSNLDSPLEFNRAVSSFLQEIGPD